MKAVHRHIFVCLLLIGVCCLPSFAQDSMQHRTFNDIVQFNGYLKDLQYADFTTLDSIPTFNYIHNRLNFKFYPCNTITGALEIRNRIYYGQVIQQSPGFGMLIDQDDGYVKLSKLLVNEKALVASTMIDRLWVDWSYKKWEVRAGRQRINWGKTLVWNPNDLFNTFNYANFDYEEQPGSDALRLSYYPGGMSAIEFAVKPGKNENETVAAAAWRFNQWNYDFQVLGGLFYNDVAIGTGWAGNISTAGCKGEATWFQPRNHLTDSTGVLTATISLDYSFRNGTYVQGALLYNSHPGSRDTINYFEQASSNLLSAKNLMPSDWSYFLEASRQFTPLFYANAAVIFGSNPSFLFTMPSVTYSISTNWELTLVEQGIFNLKHMDNSTHFNIIYLRLKWSF